MELRGFEPLTFSLRRPDTQANELLRRLLVGAWRGVEWVVVRVGGTPGVRATTASMPSTVDLCGGPTLRLAVGHSRPPLTRSAPDPFGRTLNSSDRASSWPLGDAPDTEARAKEVELIREHRSNDPAIGYNRWPKASAMNPNARRTPVEDDLELLNPPPA